jgi:uncharacterized protein YcfL
MTTMIYWKNYSAPNAGFKHSVLQKQEEDNMLSATAAGIVSTYICNNRPTIHITINYYCYWYDVSMH